MRKRPTVADLRALKGRKQLTMLRIFTVEEAAAAEEAGIDVVSVPPSLIRHPDFRAAAPGLFAMTGVDHREMGSREDYLRLSCEMLLKGADAIYCSASLETVAYLAREHVPVVGHVGLVPSRATWTGGFKAVGKTAEQALALLAECQAYEDAGAFAVEIEVVPHSITQAIAEKTGLFLISMGAGAAGHAQYLFTDDVLGQTRGKVPRHAKRYADFASERDRLQALRVEAMGRFVQDVHGGDYPAPQYLVDCDAEVVSQFRDWLDQQ